jgi:hypothetical protein
MLRNTSLYEPRYIIIRLWIVHGSAQLKYLIPSDCYVLKYSGKIGEIEFL